MKILSFQEAGFSYVELNASDTRSKKSLKGEVAEALDNKTIVDFIGIDECVRTTHINRALSQIPKNEKKCLPHFKVPGNGNHFSVATKNKSVIFYGT